MEMSGQLHEPSALLPGKAADTLWIGGWVGPRAGLLPARNLNPAFQPVTRRYKGSVVPAPIRFL
jgi:hypothetical protein